ncbi:trihelix transcription factor ASR3-like isoform X2 [Magnolia sinica]|uniref:trihelix transcription factor ASR3-like isoform X2 n=1 Tax=Magnolia sinica TaxID=86752 RepID=UPI002658B955|nr:trihelix transcription factor ASR3-like isoform X2 [Magnolia sinica]
MALHSPPPTNGAPSSSNGRYNSNDDDANRPPRLPRWTRQEILVLIQGKKVAESRVRRGRTAFGPTPAEPKWASVASYCRRHGVNRGPVQCRKRWSNLSGDYKKIKEWESRVGLEPSDSFWAMRNDVRREKKMPGFFDREVYDILDGGVGPTVEGKAGEEAEEEEGEEVIFDSGRAAAADDGLFSDFEQSGPEEGKGSPEKVAAAAAAEDESPVTEAAPISGMENEKQLDVDPEKGSASQEGRKRRRVSPACDGVPNLQDQLIEVLERNSKMLTTQLEAQNINCQLDRDQRKDHADGLIGVLSKLADALGRIADKL